MYRVQKWNLKHLIPLPHPVYTKKLLRLEENGAFLRKRSFKKKFRKKKFIKQNVGVTRVAPVSASVEACRVVGGCLSMSQFFGKISDLNIFSLIFGDSYQ